MPTSRRIRPLAPWLPSLLALAACTGAGSGDAAPPPVGHVRDERAHAPAAPGSSSSTPGVSATADGGLVYSWTERRPDSSVAIRVATWRDGTWTEARTVTEGGRYFVNWADTPSAVALPDGGLAVHWLAREGAGKYAYGIRIARSADGGNSWSAPVTPHTDGLEAEHGFVSLWAADSGSVGAVWLDGRKSAMPDSVREMTLRTARVRADGTLADEAVLDARICDCCGTSTAATRRGRVVVYRDRSPSDVRDIGIVRQVDGRWLPPALVHADGWEVHGCPVNGPAVAARGDTVAVAWFTKAQDTARVQLAISRDGGATFGAPIRIDEGDPLGRVALVLDDAARPVVSWLERQGTTRAAVLVRRVGLDGARSAPREVIGGAADRSSGFPRMARSRDSLHFFVTSAGERAGTLAVRVLTAPLQ